jgi:SAM-dependent methyltransferase
MADKAWVPAFTVDEVRAHWDQVAPIYDEANQHWLNPHEWRFIEGIKHLHPSSSDQIHVANIWSRTGNAIPFIRSMLPNATIHNFELSSEMIAIAKQVHPEECFAVTDLKTVDLGDGSVDYVMSQETLEHTPSPPRLIAELFRILKPGGRLILSLPPRVADFHQWVYETLIGGHGDGPRKGIPTWVVKPWLSDIGFVIERHKAILLFPIGPRWFIELGNRLIERLPVLRELGVMQFYICRKPDPTASGSAPAFD